MKSGSSLQALTVVSAVVFVTASLVSAAVVLLRPVQQDNRLLEQARNVLQLVGGTAPAKLPDAVLLDRLHALDARVVDLDAGRFEPSIDPYAFDAREAANDPELSRAVPEDDDRASLGRQARFEVIYLVWGEDGLERVVLPVYGMGMWSTIRGFIALESDLNTIAAANFYEQAETPGVGDRITRADWLRKWQGRRVYDEEGVPQFAVAAGRVEPGSASALHNVDGISGATVTTDAVTDMVQFWFGPWGYQSLLEFLVRNPPPRPPAGGVR